MRRIVGGLAVIVLAAGLPAAPVMSADEVEPLDVFDCTADVGDPVPGSLSWDLADQNNRWCGSEGMRTAQTNPALLAAVVANAAQGVVEPGDPFRTLNRWAGVRGDYQQVTWTDREGVAHTGELFGPLENGGGAAPGVVVMCDICSGEFGVAGLVAYRWATEVLAEHGYVVFFPDVAPEHDGTDPRTVDATDFFVSTPGNPNPHNPNQFNPWHARLDRERLGITGHSSAGGIALRVGNADPRYDAVVSWDSGASLGDLDLRTPSMLQVADYGQAGDNVPPQAQPVEEALPLPTAVTLYEPRHTKPVPAPGSKYTAFDAFRDAGVDTMQVSLRASTHGQWSTAISPVQILGGSLRGEAVAIYYTLTWFDYYLKGSSDALDRLTATSTFDDFADAYAIGTGIFDVLKAERAGDVEAGNVPVAVGGISIRNQLSWWYPSRFWLNGGDLTCEDVRGGCPS